MTKNGSIENMIMSSIIEPETHILNDQDTSTNTSQEHQNLINLDANIDKRIIKELDTDFEVYIKGTKNTTGRQTLLILPILRFFNDKRNLKKLIPILDGTSPISLRLIDWFVTNYCKKFNTMFNIKYYENLDRGIKTKIPDNFDNYFIVHSNYKGQLKTCNKKNFDPFCRRNRIQFYYAPKMYFETTVGQLNFFKWAIENFIINYIADNIKDIEKDMTINSKINTDSSKKKKTMTTNTNSSGEVEVTKKKKKKSRKNSTRKKRKELSTSASRTMYKHNYPTVISFD